MAVGLLVLPVLDALLLVLVLTVYELVMEAEDDNTDDVGETDVMAWFDVELLLTVTISVAPSSVGLILDPVGLNTKVYTPGVTTIVSM